MALSHSTLGSHSLPAGTPVHHFRQDLPESVTLYDPAINSMTDLRKVKAVTVASDVPIDAALERMIDAGVRLLIVSNSADGVVGLLSARDIMGEKPLSRITRERISRNEVLVAHVMTPRVEIQALSMEDVARAEVGDIVLTLREAGRQHALVLDHDPESGQPAVRGIFSITQIGKQLGVEIPATGTVQSFAEIEALLNTA